MCSSQNSEQPHKQWDLEIESENPLSSLGEQQVTAQFPNTFMHELEQCLLPTWM